MTNDAPRRAGRLQGVIFDMDGVLVDSHAVHRRAWRIFFQTLGCKIDEAELDFILDGRKRDDILRHFLAHLTNPELEELGRRKDCIFRQMQFEVRPINGVLDILRELRRRKIAAAVATSASRSRARSTLAQMRIEDYFQAIVTGDDVPVGKPDACIYKLVAKGMATDSAHLLAIEDSVSGIRAAVSAELQCVGVGTRERHKALTGAGAIRVISDFHELSVDQLELLLIQPEAPAKLAASPGVR
jgi:HAD superfamily hydrolase (TIGR01509 family)